ncbi:MAG TPA: integrase family protein [Terriglobales bacterium]|nr:integrase family protein [Terriglobales bacterium]
MLAHIKRRPKRPAHKRRLTELFVRKPKPGLTWDTHQRGLALRVQPGGAKAWVVVYSRSGRSRWLTLGKADAIGLSDARRLAARAMLAVAEGRDPAAERKAERGAGTFAELHERYLEGHAKKHNKSWQQADALVRRHALPRWGKLQASAIMRRDIRQMMERITAPIVANQTLAAVSAIFSWGFVQEIVAANPCKGVERNPTKDRERVLSDSELPLFWKAFGNLGERGRALAAILLLGQRPGEISAMRVEHVKDGWWELPGAPEPNGWPGTKNKQSHRLWLPEAARALIADGNGTGFVFASPRGGAVGKLDNLMRDICKTLGIEPKVTPHDLRRTHGSTITRLGHGRDAMNRVQNHREGGVTDTYDRYAYETENKRVMESVASHIMALAEGRDADDKVARPSFKRTGKRS